MTTVPANMNRRAFLSACLVITPALLLPSQGSSLTAPEATAPGTGGAEPGVRRRRPKGDQISTPKLTRPSGDEREEEANELAVSYGSNGRRRIRKGHAQAADIARAEDRVRPARRRTSALK